MYGADFGEGRLPVFDREFSPVLSLSQSQLLGVNNGLEQRPLLRQEHLQGPFGDYAVKSVLDLVLGA